MSCAFCYASTLSYDVLVEQIKNTYEMVLMVQPYWTYLHCEEHKAAYHAIQTQTDRCCRASDPSGEPQGVKENKGPA